MKKFSELQADKLYRALEDWFGFKPVEILYGAPEEVREAVEATLEPFWEERRRGVYVAAVAFVAACEEENHVAQALWHFDADEARELYQWGSRWRWRLFGKLLPAEFKEKFYEAAVAFVAACEVN
ncbi:MAG: hypothetical protein IKN16_01435 [Selenomonadaceae bacterium]|nr:hypothetical protein [Selenomonadaceae bacterium]